MQETHDTKTASLREKQRMGDYLRSNQERNQRQQGAIDFFFSCNIMVRVHVRLKGGRKPYPLTGFRSRILDCL